MCVPHSDICERSNEASQSAALHAQDKKNPAKHEAPVVSRCRVRLQLTHGSLHAGHSLLQLQDDTLQIGDRQSAVCALHNVGRSSATGSFLKVQVLL